MNEPSASRGLSGAAVLRDPLVRELLAKRLIAVLATIEPTGSVHAVPLWFVAADEEIILATGSRSRKVRNLERDPRATLVLHDSRPGFEVCGASIRGRVSVERGPAATVFVERVHRRYVMVEGMRLPAAVQFLASDDVALRFVPEAAVTWDERDSDATRTLHDARAAYPLETTSSRFEF